MPLLTELGKFGCAGYKDFALTALRSSRQDDSTLVDVVRADNEGNDRFAIQIKC